MATKKPVVKQPTKKTTTTVPTVKSLGAYTVGGNTYKYSAKDNLGNMHYSNTQSKLNNYVNDANKVIVPSTGKGLNTVSGNYNSDTTYNNIQNMLADTKKYKEGVNLFYSQDENGGWHWSTSQSGLDRTLNTYNKYNAEQAELEKMKNPQVSLITGDKEGYINGLINSGYANADKAYEAETNAAYNTWTGSLADAKENYIRNSLLNYQNQQDLANDYKNAKGNINQEGFNAVQQGRENMATRGLSNSGLGYAIDQNMIAQTNALRAQVDTDYNNNVNKLRGELAMLVETYGISKEKANDIYNRSMESLIKQRDYEYTRVLEDANAKGIAYQTDIDKFNANAQNQASLTGAQISANLYDSQKNRENQLEITDRNNNTQLKITDKNNTAAMKRLKEQIKFDKWNAIEQRNWETTMKKLDRELQWKMAKLSAETQKAVASIGASAGIRAAEIAANAQTQCEMLGLNGAGYTQTLNTISQNMANTPANKKIVAQLASQIVPAAQGNTTQWNKLIKKIKYK